MKPNSTKPHLPDPVRQTLRGSVAHARVARRPGSSLRGSAETTVAVIARALVGV